jgi:hypothetical protein
MLVNAATIRYIMGIEAKQFRWIFHVMQGVHPVLDALDLAVVWANLLRMRDLLLSCAKVPC